MSDLLPPDPSPTDPLPVDWVAALAPYIDAGALAAPIAYVAGEEAAGRRVFPSAGDRFRALALTPFAEVRVVILGQDPYHGEGQAHGLSFSVPAGVRVPPSLRNIFKELAADLGIAPAGHGQLDHWARQGVLLLNTVLSVESGRAASHANRGWERVTDAIVRAVAARPGPVVFMLWGAHAQRKAGFVTPDADHLVLTAPHPSPLSARTGWFGSGHFSKANAFLVRHGAPPIDWTLPAAG
jgi:uracil-DNA glycosylase